MGLSEVINKALACPDLPEAPGQEILTGFGHNAVLGVADKVIEASSPEQSGISSWWAAASEQNRDATTTPSSWKRRPRILSS
jgi:hypothetical protein